jgi:Xaa-Pro aminopeptidase
MAAAVPRSAAMEQIELVATRRLVEPLRAVKDADEIAAIERAVAITDETFAHLCGYLRPGMSERQVAGEIDRYMRERGADGMAFDPHVASGPNAALPHATPTERRLVLGEPIIIDMGARVAGYCSDMTRTVCLGEPGEDARAIFAAVLAALEISEDGIAPGMSGTAADALARDALTAAGYGDHFLHSLGHGLGLEIHEDPRLRRIGGDQALTPGMAITVEPGVYVGGWGGVRIEDTAIVTEDGIRVLTTAHKRFGLPQ